MENTKTVKMSLTLTNQFDSVEILKAMIENAEWVSGCVVDYEKTFESFAYSYVAFTATGTNEQITHFEKTVNNAIRK